VGTDRKAEAMIRQGIFRKATIDLVPGKTRLITKVLLPV
jgi:hypothetical protein